MTYKQLKKMTMDEFIFAYNLPENRFNIALKLESVVRLLSSEHARMKFKLLYSCEGLCINEYELSEKDTKEKIFAYNKAIRKLTS
jgi:hypothetical protein